MLDDFLDFDDCVALAAPPLPRPSADQEALRHANHVEKKIQPPKTKQRQPDCSTERASSMTLSQSGPSADVLRRQKNKIHNLSMDLAKAQQRLCVAQTAQTQTCKMYAEEINVHGSLRAGTELRCRRFRRTKDEKGHHKMKLKLCVRRKKGPRKRAVPKHHG